MVCYALVRNNVAAPNPGLLAAMLKTQRLNGVVRWKVNFTESGFLGEANLAAWNGTWLETSAVRSIQDFIDVAANQTSNSNLVGATLADLVETIFPKEIEDRKICIAWSGWQDLVKSSPESALEIAEALDQVCQERLAVVLVCDSSGTFPGISELSQG
jgi:hypothetical protein